ncbi:MAG: hypothetical protein U1E71_09375 [Ramlibacter sp.]|mgnify:FL=1
MTKVDRSRLIELLRRAFGAGRETAIGEALLTYLDEHSSTNHINLQLVRQLTPGADTGDLDKEIVRTLNFLSGDAHVLDLRFELFDDAHDHAHDLTLDEARGALADKVHPLTGQDDPAIAKKIGIYFTPIHSVSKQASHGKDGG